MHKAQQLLPRLRSSFAGNNRAHRHHSLAGYVSAAVCTCLLVLVLAQVGNISKIWGGGSLSSIISGSRIGANFSPRASSTPSAASFLQQTAAQQFGAKQDGRQQQQHGIAAVTAEAIQQLQQGMDSVSAGVSNMARTLSEQVSGSSSSSSWDTATMEGVFNATTTAADVPVGWQLASSPKDQVSFFDVSSNVKSTQDALLMRPAAYGHMQKAGVLDPTAWSANYSDARLDSFLSWRLNRTKAGGAGPASADSYSCAAADHPPHPFPGCHVFVNHQYKYIYIRSPKSASTSIVNMMGECTNTNTRGHNASTCMVLHFYWNSTDLMPANINKMWKDYFVFGFVRNPWRRAYSLYRYLHSNGCMHDKALRDESCKVPWSQFCSDPWAAAEQLHDRGCIKRSRSYLYFHMEDQYHCLRTATGEWAVDYVGRVDEANTDWAEVLQVINSRRPQTQDEIPITELEQKNVRAGNVKDPYSQADTQQCMDAVSRWYACDVEKFGFSQPAAVSHQ